MKKDDDKCGKRLGALDLHLSASLFFKPINQKLVCLNINKIHACELKKILVNTSVHITFFTKSVFGLRKERERF